jgi:hypothetical protein
LLVVAGIGRTEPTKTGTTWHLLIHIEMGLKKKKDKELDPLAAQFPIEMTPATVARAPEIEEAELLLQIHSQQQQSTYMMMLAVCA